MATPVNVKTSTQTVVVAQQKWLYFAGVCIPEEIMEYTNAFGQLNWELVAVLPGHDFSEANDGKFLCVYKKPA